MKIRVIVNPSAAAGAAGKKIPLLRRLFEERGVEALVQTTAYPGEATLLALDAAQSGVDVLGVMGGDGTFNEVAQACLSSATGGAAFGPSLSLIPAGTGGDFKRSLGLTNDLKASVERMLSGSRQRLDLGVVTERRPDAAPPRAFLNVASVGLSAVVCSLANSGPKWIGGKLMFYGAALRATFTYENLGVRVRIDDEVHYEGPAYLVAIANGRCFGGGMQIAPDASLDDGLFDVVILGNYSKLGAVSLSRAIYAGTHVSRAQTTIARGRVVEIDALSSLVPTHAILEADGEVPPTRLPLRVTLHPRAVSVCT
jgi:diacylglycerol kinase (ATP)